MAMRVKAAVDRAAGAVSTLLDTASQTVAAVADGSGNSGDNHAVYRSSGGAGVDGSYGPSGQRDDGPKPQQYHSTGGAGVEGSYGPGTSFPPTSHSPHPPPGHHYELDQLEGQQQQQQGRRGPEEHRSSPGGLAAEDTAAVSGMSQGRQPGMSTSAGEAYFMSHAADAFNRSADMAGGGPTAGSRHHHKLTSGGGSATAKPAAHSETKAAGGADASCGCGHADCACKTGDSRCGCGAASKASADTGGGGGGSGGVHGRPDSTSLADNLSRPELDEGIRRAFEPHHRGLLSRL